MHLLKERRKCPLCGGGNRKDLWKGYNECLDCGCVYILWIDRNTSYESDYYYFDEGDEPILRERAKILFRIFSKFKSKETKDILDYGCGQGYFVEECLKNGLDAYGVDVSSFIKGRVKSSLKDRIFLLKGKLKEIFSERKFDIITLWDVIEHLENPLDVLKEIKSYLKPKGTILISTPNAKSFWVKILTKEWHGFGIPRYHVTYFNKNNLYNILEKNGYKNVSIYTMNPIGKNTFFLVKNLAVGLTRKCFKKDNKLIFAIMAGIIIFPEKIFELVAPYLNIAETLVGIGKN